MNVNLLGFSFYCDTLLNHFINYLNIVELSECFGEPFIHYRYCFGVTYTLYGKLSKLSELKWRAYSYLHLHLNILLKKCRNSRLEEVWHVPISIQTL